MFGWHLKYKIWHIFKWSKQQSLYLFIAYLFFPRTMGTYYFYPVYHLWLPWVSFLFLCCHIVQEVNTLRKLNAWYIDLVALGTLVLLIADNIGTILSVPNEAKPFSVSCNREAGILFKKKFWHRSLYHYYLLNVWLVRCLANVYFAPVIIKLENKS